MISESALRSQNSRKESKHVVYGLLDIFLVHRRLKKGLSDGRKYKLENVL